MAVLPDQKAQIAKLPGVSEMSRADKVQRKIDEREKKKCRKCVVENECKSDDFLKMCKEKFYSVIKPDKGSIDKLNTRTKENTNKLFLFLFCLFLILIFLIVVFSRL